MASTVPEGGDDGDLADAYRRWALQHPRRYALIFGIPDDGVNDSPEAIAEIHKGMIVLLLIFADLAGNPPGTGRPDELDRQRMDWAQRRAGTDRFSLPVLRLGVLFWTRLHGIVSLELSSAFEDVGLNAGVLLDDEVKRAVDRATGRNDNRG